MCVCVCNLDLTRYMNNQMEQSGIQIRRRVMTIAQNQTRADILSERSQSLSRY